MIERTIKVTGTGKVSFKPNITLINIMISDVLPTYGEALKKSTEDILIIRGSINRAGVDENGLKTTEFNVDTSYASIKDKNGNYKRYLEGFRYRLGLRLQFDIDNDLLGRLLFELSELSLNLTFNISFGIKDNEAAKNELLRSAIKDAINKSRLIAECANVKLKEIIDISYSWVNVDFSSDFIEMECNKKMLYAAPTGSNKFDIDLDPEDIDKSDNVTIVYSIE